MNTLIYVCEGSCHAKISQEQYEGGLVACGASECDKKGHQFTKMYECSECGVVHPTDRVHPHE